MTAGYTGKILRINLTNGTTSIIDTEKYEEFCGGNGMGTAIFWDLCQDKAISGFDPRNVITIMPGPNAGTFIPGGNRMEICGVGTFSYPVEWFTRSNIGGFFSSMLKYAGWDGIVIEGKASKPVWVNIINDKVTIEDAGSLWGQLADTAQAEIWRRVTGRDSFGEWLSLGDTQTTQGPSILCIGPGGETMSRLGSIQSGLGVSASEGGFGGIWGAKNLKAISVLGTGNVKVADPVALLATRNWANGLIEQKPAPVPNGRQVSCAGCFWKCKSRIQSGQYQDGMCLRSMYRSDALPDGRTGSDIISLYGFNMNELAGVSLTDGVYVDKLYKMGVLGPGKEIESSPVPFEKFANAEYAEALCKAMANREGIGADLTEGLMRAAAKWGRLEQDLASGLLHKAHWGYGWHWSLPNVEQPYSSLVSDREIVEHIFTSPRIGGLLGSPEFMKIPTEKIVEMLSKKTIPYTGDPFMFDYNWQEPDGSNMAQALATGIYSEHKAKFVAWHRHYSRFYIQSALYCDYICPCWLDPHADDWSGLTPDFETRFLNAVTGKNMSFAEGMETGRKIWNINRAIWVLQGRHRDMENLSAFMFTTEGSNARSVDFRPPPGPPVDGPGGDKPAKPPPGPPPALPGGSPLPVYKNGKWTSTRLVDMYLDKAGVEQWKTHYYKIEGWDTETGWPSRGTLEELGLKKVADALESAGKLGASGTYTGK
jgi:aldehyde:ferredoxin oxidoreductase